MKKSRVNILLTIIFSLFK